MIKCLIVDDNSANLYLLKTMLAAMGWDVREAQNGRIALDMAKARPPDIIISDILMPVMDGYDLIRQCKTDDNLKNIPFVFYTATYTEARDEKFALSLGADRFVVKPQEPDVLINILTGLMEEKKAASPAESKPLGEEMEFLRQHNETLFRKLEKKMSDLEKTNRKLKILGDNYRLIIEHITDVLYMMDTSCHVLNMSPSVEKILGYKPENFIGRTVDDLAQIFTPQSYAQAVTDSIAILNGETISEKVYEFIASDGTVKIGEVSGSPIMRDGKIAGMVAVARDITERKLAEEKYRNIFENAQEGIARSTPEGKFIMANKSMAQMLGYDSPEELIAGVTDMTHQIYVDSGDRAKLIGLMETQDFADKFETRFRKKDGGIIWVSMTLRAVRDEKGKVIYYEGILADITDRKQSVERLRNALEGTVRAIALIVETRDPYTAGHQRRVSELARDIAVEMGLPEDRVEGLRVAATIHDIGKISVPAEMLTKPTRLTKIEFTIIQTHVQAGYDILKDIEFPWPVARMVVEHHERINGSGYPNGLNGGNLLQESRIMAVADVVEAMASHRPYRPSLGIEPALEEIEKNRGILYDPDAVDACLRLFRQKGYKLE